MLETKMVQCDYEGCENEVEVPIKQNRIVLCSTVCKRKRQNDHQVVWRKNNQDKVKSYQYKAARRRSKQKLNEEMELQFNKSPVVKEFKCQRCGKVCGHKHEDGTYTGNRLTCDRCQYNVGRGVDAQMVGHSGMSGGW